ncbi:MAG: hypothetical protein FWD36_02360 [Treponema sp.]|nr:hypothetical protein [Treponema sp.]
MVCLGARLQRGTLFWLVIAFISVLIAAGLWVLGIVLPAGGMPAKGWAVLICSGDIPDRDIRERLENGGFGGLISESGQWVLLDSFSRMEQVPLDEYETRVLPFDPRNDGYAEKLRSLFVRDDTRFVYIPLGSLALANPAKTERKLAAALGAIPYALEYHAGDAMGAGSGLPPVYVLALFCFAACTFFIMRPLRLELKPHLTSLIPCLPLLAPLALGGAVGFALASLLAGFAVLLAGNWFESRRRYVLPKLLAFFLLLFCGVLAFFSGLSPVFTLVVIILFCSVLFFSLWNVSRKTAIADRFDRFIASVFSPGHRRFSPVPILVRRSSGFCFSWVMLPFAAAALVLVLIHRIAVSAPADFTTVIPPAMPPGVTLVTEADYAAHYMFQSVFSVKSLYAPERAGMSNYQFAPDGLPVYAGFAAVELPPHIPPFPLADFFQSFYATTRHGSLFPELLLVLVPLLFILPSRFFARGLRKSGLILSS